MSTSGFSAAILAVVATLALQIGSSIGGFLARPLHPVAVEVKTAGCDCSEVLRESLQYRDVADWWRGAFFVAAIVSILSWIIAFLSCGGPCQCAPCLWLTRPRRSETARPPALQIDDQRSFIQDVSEENDFVFSPSRRRC